MNTEMFQKIVENRPAMVVVIIVTATAAVLSIATGFVVTYHLITMIGA